ncbi:hypothetical protein FGIG_08449 [Fasciola gigantica]|uniref:Uncharacterized protein n=1 Tax=Fasciola gigantica TaxID=46835 RepID=A0A504Y8C4_FASGI|nr:hypothetical protein FGIG_08449 [Fasciola gigantica]
MADSRIDVQPAYQRTYTERSPPSEESETKFDPFEDEYPMVYVNFKKRYKYDPRAFYTRADVAKLPESPLKRWITDYSMVQDQPEEFCIRGHGADIRITRSSAAQNKIVMPLNEERDKVGQQHISEWLLTQPVVMGFSDRSNFVQSGEISDSIRSMSTTRASKQSFVQMGLMTCGGTPNNSVRSNATPEHEKNGFPYRFWRRSTRHSGTTTDENEFNIASDNHEDAIPLVAHKRTSIKSLWASFKERVSRVSFKNNTIRSKSLATNEKKRRNNKVRIECESNTGQVEMYVNVIRNLPTPQQHSIKSTPERRESKTNEPYETNGQCERIIYIKPR